MLEIGEIQNLCLRLYKEVGLSNWLSEAYYGKIPDELERKMHKALLAMDELKIPTNDEFESLSKRIVAEYRSNQFVENPSEFEALKTQMERLYQHFKKLARLCVQKQATVQQIEETCALGRWFNFLRGDYNRLGLPFLLASKFELPIPVSFDLDGEEERG